MKKTVIVIFAALCVNIAAFAQSRAIGARIGATTELSYQHDLSQTLFDLPNFLEVDGGLLFGHGIYASALYDVIFASADNFNFYAGPGLSVGLYNYKDSNDKRVSGADAGLCANVGVEYLFDEIPLGLSLDWRPHFYFGDTGVYGGSICLGIRYMF